MVRSVSSFPGQVCCALESRNHRLIPNLNLDLLHTQISPALPKTLCTLDLPFRNRHTIFIVTLELPSSTIRNNWPFEKIFHLLLHLDQSSMEMWSLPLLRPISFSTHYALHQDQKLTMKETLRFSIGLFPTVMPSNRAPVIIPSIITPAIIKPKIVSVNIVSVTRLCRFLSF